MSKAKQELTKPESTVVTVKTHSVLPSLDNMPPRLAEQFREVKDNLESLETVVLPRAKNTATGFELIEGELPSLELEGVILYTRKQNVYYSKPYNPSADVAPPDCFSQDGVLPDASIEKPQHKTCAGCPMSEYGTNSMQSGKACRNLKPVYMLLGDESIMPRQVIVTPVSLKSANAYLMGLTERGLSYRKVKTLIKLEKGNVKDTYYKMTFKMGAKLSPERVLEIEAMKNFWLPAMNNQMVQQNEVDSSQSRTVETSNEY